MKPLICSVYYPHTELKYILQSCLQPAVEELKNIFGAGLLNFRLSTYKGENIILSLDCPDPETQKKIKDFITGSVNKFFSLHPKNFSEVQFPIHRLFMDMPPQTVHFWGKNPFKEKMILVSDPEADKRIRSLVSRYCLWQISINTPLQEEKLFNLYLRILILFRKMVNNPLQNGYTDFQNMVFSRLKEMKNGSEAAIESLYNLSREVYIQNDARMNKLIHQIFNQIENSGSGNMDIPLIHWKSLLDEIENIRSDCRGAELNQFYLDLFFEITQKISLRMDELIKAIAVITEFSHKHMRIA